MYFRIEKIISENQKYGSNFINSLSTSLKIEFPDTTGFSPRNLVRMRKFYETYKDLSNLPPAVAKLPWTHNSILVERISDATGFSPRNLSRMKKLYETYKDLSNLPPALAKLPWTHNSILVERISDVQRLLDFLSLFNHFCDKRDQID